MVYPASHPNSWLVFHCQWFCRHHPQKLWCSLSSGVRQTTSCYDPNQKKKNAIQPCLHSSSSVCMCITLLPRACSLSFSRQILLRLPHQTISLSFDFQCAYKSEKSHTVLGNFQRMGRFPAFLTPLAIAVDERKGLWYAEHPVFSP